MGYDDVAWIGESGTEYIYYVFPIDAEVPARSGSYIYAKRNEEGLWAPVYMGRGDLAKRCSDPSLLDRIAAKEATHVHLRLNRRENDRIEELADLLTRYKNAFAPVGCHSPDDPRAAPQTISGVTP